MRSVLRSPAVLWVGLVLALAGIAISLGQRHRVEAANRAVSLAVEYDTVEAYAAVQGVPVAEALENLKQQGLTSVVLAEETIGELVSMGHVTIEIQTFGDRGLQPVPTLVCHDQTAVGRISMGLRIRFPKSIGNLNTRGNVLLLPDLDTNVVRATSVGLNPDQARTVREKGLTIIARASNPAGVTNESVRATVQWLRQLGATVFLPQGDQVLGRREAMRAFTDALASNGLIYASPEFARIGGDSQVLSMIPDQAVRLHAAQAIELDRMGPVDAVERYTKAARERGMRILLLRPVTSASESPLASLADFVRKVNQGVTHDGGAMGVARPYEAVEVPTLAFALITLGAVLVALQALALGGLPDRWLLVALAVSLALIAASVLRGPRELVALALSIALPIVGFLVLDHLRPKEPVVGVLLLSVYALLGGLCVAGLLNGLPYLIRADQFPGVKLSVFFPILVVGVIAFVRLTDFRAALGSPITWGTAALSAVVLAAIGVMLMRTGNDSPAGVSDTELRFRGLLDALLYVRPRTKEFMLGHPALVIGVGMLGMLRRQDLSERKRAILSGWACLAILLGMMGQTSIVNTLCHLHTPVLLSLARIGIGLVAGCIMGMVLWVPLSRWIAKAGG